MRDKNLPVLFLNLLRSKVKWKLFYDAKTMFVSAFKVWRGIFFKHNYRQACHTTLSNSIELNRTIGFDEFGNGTHWNQTFA